MRSFHAVIVLLVAVSTACGSGGGSGDDDGVNDHDGGAVTPDGGDGGEYVDLISAQWTKSPGSDTYYCAYKTVTQDMYITSFRALAPLGTHHTVVSVTDTPTRPDGAADCEVGTIANELLFASGVGTSQYDLPEGVAVKVAAGQQIQLQLHLFNISEGELAGLSGTQVKLASPASIEHEAEFFFAGTFDIDIDDNGEDHTVTGDCNVATDGTVFTLWPHMHQIGKHMTIEINDQMVLDEPYSFTEQEMYPIDPIAVKAGDKISVTCTWNNPIGNGNVGFGDQSNDEMCFGGVYRYPAVDTFAFCTGVGVPQ